MIRKTEADCDGVVKDDIESLLRITSPQWIAWLDDCRRDLRTISTQDGREYQVRQEARRRWVATCLREQTVTRDERGRPVYPDQPHDETEASDQAARLEALSQAWCECRREIPAHEHESVSRWIERSLAVVDRRGARIVGKILARHRVSAPEPQRLRHIHASRPRNENGSTVATLPPRGQIVDPGANEPGCGAL